MNVVKGVKGFAFVDLESRFWAKVKKGSEDECWPWLGSRKARGYGEIWVDGRNQKASRVSWSIHNKAPFPPDKQACHSCDNPPCVNPKHIWVGTMSDNIKDAARKGRVKPPRTKPKTHCHKGHPYDFENTGLSNFRGRFCKACKLANAALAKYGAKEERG